MTNQIIQRVIISITQALHFTKGLHLGFIKCQFPDLEIIFAINFVNTYLLYMVRSIYIGTESSNFWYFFKYRMPNTASDAAFYTASTQQIPGNFLRVKSWVGCFAHN